MTELFTAPLVRHLGDRLGLYRDLADRGPAASSERVVAQNPFNMVLQAKA